MEPSGLVRIVVPPGVPGVVKLWVKVDDWAEMKPSVTTAVRMTAEMNFLTGLPLV